MSLLTIAELKQHVETDLSDAALQRIIDGIESDIDQFAGSTAAIIDVRDYQPGDFFVFLSQPASAIQSVVEYNGGVALTLSANDYTIWNDGYMLERSNSGTNPSAYWRGRVTVTFTPISYGSKRKMVAVDLCKLELQYNGVVNESAGGYALSVGDFESNRRKILSRLRAGIGIV